MKFTLEDWRALDAAKQDVKEAMRQLDYRLLCLLKKHHEDLEEAIYINKFLAANDINLPDCSVVSEWVGGDSSEPDNYKYREPHCCGLSNRRYL